jgi:hypothetical protein
MKPGATRGSGRMLLSIGAPCAVQAKGTGRPNYFWRGNAAVLALVRVVGAWVGHGINLYRPVTRRTWTFLGCQGTSPLETVHVSGAIKDSHEKVQNGGKGTPQQELD